MFNRIDLTPLQNEEYSSAYQQVISNIHEYADVQINGQISLTSKRPRGILSGITSYRSFNVPTMSVSFNNLNDEVVGQIKEMGMLEDPKTKFTFRGSPGHNELSKLLKLHPNEKEYIPGGVPINGYIAYIFCLRAMKLFSFMSEVYQVNQHSVRVCRNDLEDDTGLTNMEHPDAFFSNLMDGEVVHCNMQAAIRDDDKKKHVLYGAIGFLATPLTKNSGIFDRSITSEYKFEKGQSGLLFPYFQHMVLTDKDFTATVFSRLFFKCLGNDYASCGRLWGRIRHGLRSLAVTQAGQAISHAFMGINLAENSQSCVRFIIDNGVYHGFVLLGSFRVILSGTTLENVGYEDLNIAMRVLQVKEKRLQEIVNIIRSKVDDDGDIVYNITIESIKTSRRFANVFQSLDEDLFDDEELKDITDKISDVSFGESYPVVNLASLTHAFNHILTGNDDILQDYPYYLQGGYFRAKDRVSKALGIFGPLAPSFNFGTRQEMKIVFPNALANDNNMTLKEDGKRQVPLLPYKLVPVRTAVIQTDAMLSKGTLFIPDGRKGKTEFSNATKRDGQIHGDDLVKIYNLLKSLVNMKRASGDQRKRKLEENDSGKKGKRARNDEAMDLDADLI